jgi:hypothetical protein
MNELKEVLNTIFEKHKQKYKPVYNNSGTFQSHADNGNNFSPIFKNLSDELISSANDYLDKNGSESKTEIENYLKELLKNFSALMINPFE